MTLGVAAVSETVNVVGSSADVLTQTAQVATNFKQDLIATLPTNRDINATLLLAPAVHPTGPERRVFDRRRDVVRDAVHGERRHRQREPARTGVQPLHRGRDPGDDRRHGRHLGGVRPLRRRRGQRHHEVGRQPFSGSFRDTLNNDNWRTLTPFETTQIADDPAHTELRIDKTVPTYEYTLGGPVAKDQLWFFTAGPAPDTGERTISSSSRIIPYTFTDETRRFEGKGTYSINSNHTFQGTYTKIIAEPDEQHVQHVRLDGPPQASTTASCRRICSPPTTTAFSVANFFVEGRVSSRHFSFIGVGAPSTDLINGTLLLDTAARHPLLVADLLRRLRSREARQHGRLREGHLLPVDQERRLAQHGVRLRPLQRQAVREQPPVGQRLSGSSAPRRSSPARTSSRSSWATAPTIIQCNPIPMAARARTSGRTQLFVNDNWRVEQPSDGEPRPALRQEPRRGQRRATGGERQRLQPARRRRLGSDRRSRPGRSPASFAKYVAAISNSIADSSSAAGNPQTFRFLYRGPSINPTQRPDDADAGCDRGGLQLVQRQRRRQPAAVGRADHSRRHARQIQGSLDSPNNLEYATGVSRSVRQQVPPCAPTSCIATSATSTPRSSTPRPAGSRISSASRSTSALIQNSNDLTRRYRG